MFDVLKRACVSCAILAGDTMEDWDEPTFAGNTAAFQPVTQQLQMFSCCNCYDADIDVD